MILTAVFLVMKKGIFALIASSFHHISFATLLKKEVSAPGLYSATISCEANLHFRQA